MRVAILFAAALGACDDGNAPVTDNSVEWKWTFLDRECPGGLDRVEVVVARQYLVSNEVQQEDVDSSSTPCTGRMTPIVLPDFGSDSTQWITYAYFKTGDDKVYAKRTKTFDTFPNTPVANVFTTEIAGNHGYVELTTVFVDAITQTPLTTCPHAVMSSLDGSILSTREPHDCTPVVLPGVPDGAHRVFVGAFDGPGTAPVMRFGSVDVDVTVRAGEVTPLTVMIPE